MKDFVFSVAGEARAPAGFALPSPLASTARAWRACDGRVLFRHLLERVVLGGELFFVGVGHVRGDVGAVGVARVGGVVSHALGHRRPLVGEGAALAAQMLGALLFLQVSAVRAGATLSSMSMMVVTLCSGPSSRQSIVFISAARLSWSVAFMFLT